MPEPGRQKDVWDKADIIGKFFSGVVLAVIALTIKCGTDEIAASQHRGELVRSLIGELTTKNQRTRQDLALIALNHSIGTQNPTLVVEICERLLVDSTGYAAGDGQASQALQSVAYDILRKRDRARADVLKHLIEGRYEVKVTSDPSLRAALRSAPDTAAALPVADSAAASANALLAPLASRVVFIQFGGGTTRERMEMLRAQFAAAGFTAPGVEMIDKPFSSAVRYFHAEDSSLAAQAQRVTLDFSRANAINVARLPIENMSRGRFRVPRGQIEVWLNAPRAEPR